MTQSPDTSALPQFSQLTIQGEDAEKFFQGQLTCDVTKLGLSYQAAAIGNLKGRIEFGIWIKKQAEKQYDVVISADCADALQAHLKKNMVHFLNLKPARRHQFILVSLIMYQLLVIKTTIIRLRIHKLGCNAVLPLVTIGS